MAETQPAPGEGSAARRFLTFRIDERRYAIPADQVSEVVRVPPVARVPLAPASLLGLANLRGSVLPVVSLRRLLGRGEGEDGAAVRAIVLDGGSSVALVVDQVDALVTVAPERIETRQAAVAARENERLEGAFADGSESEPTRILDVRAVVETAFVRRERPARAARATPVNAAQAAGTEDADERPGLVVFQVAGQSFALPLAVVQEIVSAPEAATAVPQGDASVLGVVPYRETLLPLLSLRRLLGLEQGAASAPKVIVTTVGGALVGLVADRMQAIIPADPALIEPIPAVLAARTGGEARIGSIYRGDSERGLVSILAPERLFREDVMQRLGTGSAGLGARDEGVAEANAEGIRFIVFRLGDDEFGLPIEAVDEVARVPDKVTRVPRTPAFLEGVVNLRGDVLPVIDGRRRFDMPPAEAAERRRLLVVRSERHRAGLIVDDVLGISFATREAIEPAPDVTGEATRLVQGVVNLEAEGRIVLLLEPADLLTRTERGLIDALAGEAEA